MIRFSNILGLVGAGYQALLIPGDRGGASDCVEMGFLDWEGLYIEEEPCAPGLRSDEVRGFGIFLPA